MLSARYALLLFLLAPVFFVVSIRHFIKYRGRNFLSQRFLARRLPMVQRPIWFHCASVGEVVTARPLIDLFHQHNPQQTILVTTATITGAATCMRLLPYATHSYLPLDYRFTLRRFLKRINPVRLVVLETEIWPNLYRLCANNKIQIDLVNGRLSSRSTQSRAFIRQLYQQALKNVQAIYCRTTQDQQAFIKLGAKPEQTSVVDNLKFSAGFTDNNLPRPIERRYVIAASTREHEEEKIIRLWQQAETNQLLLVIAPRHPERKDSILNTIQPLCHHISVRSLNDAITERTDLYLADTFGELARFYAHAEFVIIGGSFVDKGGQNLLEPARLGKAVLCGASMSNFAAETELLIDNDATIQADDDNSAIEAINRLVIDLNYRNEMGQRAAELVKQKQQVAERYFQLLTK